MLGSGVFTDVTSASEALEITDGDWISVGEELNRIGYVGEEACEAYDIHVHLEQGPKSEKHGTSVGIVEGVYADELARVIEGVAKESDPPQSESSAAQATVRST